MSKNYRFLIPGAVCAACSSTIKNLLIKIPELGIKEEDCRIDLRYDPPTLDLEIQHSELSEKAIKELVVTTLDLYECIDPNSVELDNNEVKDNKARDHLIKGIIGIVSGILILGLCLSHLFIPPFFAYLLAAGSTALTLYLGKDCYRKAGQALLSDGSMNMNTLYSLSTLIAIGISLASLFVPELPLMFDAALLILGFSHVGEALKKSLVDKINHHISFRSLAKEEYRLNENDKKPIKALLPGDILFLKSGDVLPVDGELLDESASIYKTLINGKNYAEEQKKGSILLAGSKVAENSTLRLRVKGSACRLYLANEVPQTQEMIEKISADYRYNVYILVGNELYFCDKYQKTCRRLPFLDDQKRMQFQEQLAQDPKLIEGQDFTLRQLRICNALTGHFPYPESYLALLDAKMSEPGEEADIEKTANTIIKYFIPTVLLLSLGSALLFSWMFSPLSAAQCALSLLVSACPCTLGLFVALAFKVGITTAIVAHFKDANALQAASEVEIVLLDLNGTLTKGMPEVSSGQEGLSPCNIKSSNLVFLAALEQESPHVFAKTISHYLKNDHGITETLKMENIDRKHHAGISATYKNKLYQAGNKQFMIDQGFRPEDLAKAEIPGHQAEHVVYFACDDKPKTLLGCILLHDPLRPDARALVKELNALNKEVQLCTGADERTAAIYAKKLGIKIVNANCIAISDGSKHKDKVKVVSENSQRGRVCMIGDGTNDTAAIKASYFGVAVESNASHFITRQQASAYILQEEGELNLMSIIAAFRIAKKTISKVESNLYFSLAYNVLTVLGLGGLYLGLGYIVHPAVGAFLMVLQAALILANTYAFSDEEKAYANDRKMEGTPNSNLKISSSLIYNAHPSPTLKEEITPWSNSSTLAPSLENFANTPSRDSLPMPQQKI